MKLLYAAAGLLIGLLCRPLCLALERRLAAARGRDYPTTCLAEWLAAGVTALCCGILPLLFSAPLQGLLVFCLLIPAVAVAMLDIRLRIIPNDLVLAILLIRLLFGIPALLGVPGFPEFRIGNALLGMTAAFLVFLLPSFTGKQVGAGDLKLAAAMGFCLGWQGALAAIVLMGLLVLAYAAATPRMPFLAALKTNIPMGPFLSGGMIAVLLLRQLPNLAAVLG